MCSELDPSIFIKYFYMIIKTGITNYKLQLQIKIGIGSTKAWNIKPDKKCFIGRWQILFISTA